MRGEQKMNESDRDLYLLGQAQAEHLRKPGPGDIEFYRNRARTAEAEVRKLRSALMEIATAKYSEATRKSEWVNPTPIWEAAALLALGDKEVTMRPLTPHEDDLVRKALRASSVPVDDGQSTGE